MSRCSEWIKLREPCIFELQACSEETFIATRHIWVFSFWVFSLQWGIFSLQRLAYVLPMSNARAAAKKGLAAVATLCLLLYWLSPLQRKIFSLQDCPRFAPKNFQTCIFFYWVGKPRYTAEFLRYSDGPLLSSYLAGSLQQTTPSLQQLASAFSCFSFFAVARLGYAAAASLYLFFEILAFSSLLQGRWFSSQRLASTFFWDLLGSLVHCNESESRCNG